MNLLKFKGIACLVGALLFTLFPSLALATILAFKEVTVTWTELSIWGVVIFLQWGLFYFIFRDFK